MSIWGKVDDTLDDYKVCPLCETVQKTYFFRHTNIGEICIKCYGEGKKEQVLL